ncbi:[NiFe]-hydrogenase assembly chaperone HybE [Bradyrhizobium sp. CIAT3101]|uniref:[NiFe]-hydrogenase assembly chaperone HybE n=1 Tax=Bradyrhizobium sp. CIAT3101 TaxID=439387 RepID=UPI0024B1E4C8|nr:[NiFe]-hydrogenase assembly chaperone HybE [Bradyrhizobium sp. CIAT3101]WFU80385.1 [NiFe]-hydrogenase assembly chaperone HybE [Bradyrhizobium sp. CIAT3101]
MRAMRDPPIYNDALGVEAGGFRPFSASTIGKMVTPWFMKRAMPRDDIVRAAFGSSLLVHLPTGTIELTLNGGMRISLFSPMLDFADLAVAQAAAEAGLGELRRPADSEEAVCYRAPAIGAIERLNFLRGVSREPRA